MGRRRSRSPLARGGSGREVSPRKLTRQVRPPLLDIPHCRGVQDSTALGSGGLPGQMVVPVVDSAAQLPSLDDTLALVRAVSMHLAQGSVSQQDALGALDPAARALVQLLATEDELMRTGGDCGDVEDLETGEYHVVAALRPRST